MSETNVVPQQGELNAPAHVRTPRIRLTPPSAHSAGTAAALRAAHEVPDFGIDVEATVRWCVQVGAHAPAVGGGRTVELWELLAATAALDVGAGRILEPHVDALSILRQAGSDFVEDRDPLGLAAVDASAQSSWGVFAAEAPGSRLAARRHGAGWVLEGTKAWCSLAESLSHALVTATLDDGTRGLFAVSLRDSSVSPHSGPWHPRGLSQVVSAPVDFAGTPSVPVGEPGWYLSRPGFAWGGMSVAAVWWGAVLPIAEAIGAASASGRADQIALMHAGRADAAVWAARAVLAEASALIDGGANTTQDPRILAGRVRDTVATQVAIVMREADAALGPAPLVQSDAYPRRVADLHLYLRQHHGDRDAARLGRYLAAASEA